METRGRKSRARLTVVSSTTEPRLAPPEYLSASQVEAWRGITAAWPAGWFGADILPLLEAFVQHAAIARTVADQLDAFREERLTTNEGLKRFGKLVSIHQKQIGMLCTLATKLRITQQTRFSKKAAATAARRAGRSSVRPWEQKPAASTEA